MNTKTTNKISLPANNKPIWISISVLFLIIITLSGFLFFKNDKIAYVDSAKILTEFKGAAQAKKAYETKAKTWQANIDTLTMGVQNAIKKYEKDLASMSVKEQELSKRLIGNQQKQLEDYQRAIQDNARQEDGKLTQTVVTQVNAFLLDYGKKNNYKMILIASQAGTIAYAREGLDITEEVIKELNEQYENK